MGKTATKSAAKTTSQALKAGAKRASTKPVSAAAKKPAQKKAVAKAAAEARVLVEVSAELARELVKSKQGKLVKSTTPSQPTKASPAPKRSGKKEEKEDWIDKYFGIWADAPVDLKKLREEQWGAR
jgi:hypothetical protein